VALRATPAQAAVFREAADREGLHISAWFRMLASERVRRLARAERVERAAQVER
jgi:hypothetical protein